MTTRVILKPRKAQPFFARHPWVFAGAIARVEGAPAAASAVPLYSAEGEFIAHGIINPQSKIAVRLYSWDEATPLTPDFFRQQLVRAIQLRRDLGLLQPDGGCRLVNSEGDGLSGCTVDYYAGWLTIQFTALALEARREMFVTLLNELLQPPGIYLRTEKGMGVLEGMALRDGLVSGAIPPPVVAIREHGLTLLVNIAEGQKTGYYFDQRANRQAVATFARGRRVLDAFSYTGGFGLACASAGASHVDCVDASELALTLAQRNAAQNQLAITTHQADVFKHLDALVAEQQRYGLIVLDPPKFARTRAAIPQALRGYRQLLKTAVRLLEPNGYLAFCCCSGLISADELAQLHAEVAASEQRSLQILDRRGAAADHPISAACLESAYLKCFISRVS